MLWKVLHSICNMQYDDGLSQPVPRISPLFAAPSPSLEFQYWAISSHAQFVYTGGFLWVESWLSSLPVCHLEGSTQAFHLSVTSWEPQEPALHSQGSRVPPPPGPCAHLSIHTYAIWSEPSVGGSRLHPTGAHPELGLSCSALYLVPVSMPGTCDVLG